MLVYREAEVPTIRTEGRLDNADFRRSGVKTGKCAPVIDNQPGTYHVRSSINSTSLRREQGANHQPRDVMNREK